MHPQESRRGVPGGLGDAWWELAQDADEDENGPFLSRAGQWYRIASRDASGLEKIKIQKRLAAIRPRAAAGQTVAQDKPPAGQEADETAMPLRPRGKVSMEGLDVDEEGWVSLAPLVQADRDTKDAGWKWNGETATFSAGKPTASVSFPVAIGGSYELQTRVTIVRAKERTAIFLPVSPKRSATFMMKGDRGNSESPTATCSLKGLKPAPRPLANPSIDIGTEYALSCKVVGAGNRVAVEIRRDAQVLFQWAGFVVQVAETSTMRPATVQLDTAYYTVSRYADLRLKMLSGKAAALFPEAKPADGGAAGAR